MKNSILATLMLGFIYTFRAFDLMFIMTSGGPLNSTDVLGTYAYQLSFTQFKFSKGAAAAMVLFRCAWAGSQRYGALVWSGDIKSSFGSMKNQVAAGLNMGIAGIPWWTTDIGGFFGANINDPAFHELLIRWFQYGCFCPVMRMHGYRWPLQPQHGTTDGAACVSGAVPV